MKSKSLSIAILRPMTTANTSLVLAINSFHNFYYFSRTTLVYVSSIVLQIDKPSCDPCPHEVSLLIPGPVQPNLYALSICSDDDQR